MPSCKYLQFLLIVILSIGTDVGSSDSDVKLCRARRKLLPINLYQLEVSALCYDYSAPFRIRPDHSYTVIYNSVINDTYVVSILIDKKPYFLNYMEKESQDYMRQSFTTDYFYELWYSCAEDAVSCCENRMDNHNIMPSAEFCPALWDGWSCFEPTRNGTTEYKACPKYPYSADTTICVLENTKKECFPNSTWNQDTDYVDCSLVPVLTPRHTFHIDSLIISVVLSAPAVLIFFIFRKFRSILRLALHRNLILCLMCRNMITIFTSKYIFLDALEIESDHVMENNGAGCKVLAVLYSMFNNGTYACMFVDGFYLHKSIVRAFANEPKAYWLYGMVAFFSIVPSISWAIARAVHEGESCWMLDDSSDQWINDSIRLVILILNIVLLLDIIRVLLMKLKNSQGSNNNSSKPAMATLKATMFLMPLFGVYIFIIMNPKIVPDHSCASENIYYYVCYVIESLQAVMVAVLFCYLSTEVHAEIKNFLRKTLIHLEQRFGFQFRRDSEAMRRATTATFVGSPGVLSNNNNKSNNNNNENTSKNKNKKTTRINSESNV